MNIIIQFDSSTALAPAGFFTAVQYAVAQADALITNNLTITVSFGWGTLNGQPITGNPVGASNRSGFYFTYGQVVSALAAAATTFDDASSISSLPILDPSLGAGIGVSTAQALALGLTSPSTVAPLAGSVALNPADAYTFDPSNRAVPSKFDAIGVLYHEISEVLGRTSRVGNAAGILTLLDLFRYSASGSHTTSAIGAWFSADGGRSLQMPFNDPANGGDAGDWANSVTADSFRESVASGALSDITQQDLRELDVMGYHLATPVVTSVLPTQGATTVSTWPTIAVFFDQNVLKGQGNIVIHRAADGSIATSVPVTDATHAVVGNGELDVFLPAYLDFGTRYFVTIDGGAVTDALGETFIGLGTIATEAFTTPTSSQEIAFWLVSVLRAADAPAAAFGNQLVGGLANGSVTQASALTALLQAAEATSSVATLSYEFFTGGAPSAGGMDFLVSPTGPNPNNLNSAYYQSFNLENRYINFAVNLGKNGAGNASFTSHYGSLSLFEATRQAYATIFGGTPSDTKLHALLDPALQLGGQTMTRADYFAFYGGDGPTGIGTKAAMVGWLLAEAVKADLGTYALSNDAFLADIALHNAPFAVDIVGHYGQPSFTFNPG